jgi:mycothiol synthase
LALESGEIIGAVSLMRTENFVKVGKGRFSIFHARTGLPAIYRELLRAIRPHTWDLQNIYLFIPETRADVGKILEKLGFRVERYSFILERSGPTLPAPVFPAGMEVIPLGFEDIGEINQFVDCINEEFKELAGHTPSTVDFMLTWFEDASYIPGGICLLKEGEQPIGTIVMMHDLDEMTAGEIMAFGILETYRGRDLGRNLFRYGFNFLIDQGLEPVYLAVNGENRGAIRLYESEGFSISDSVVCYSMDPGRAFQG